MKRMSRNIIYKLAIVSSTLIAAILSVTVIWAINRISTSFTSFTNRMLILIVLGCLLLIVRKLVDGGVKEATQGLLFPASHNSSHTKQSYANNYSDSTKDSTNKK